MFNPRLRSPDRGPVQSGLAVALVAMAVLLSACSGRSAAEPYHRTLPSELYLYTPPNYTSGTPTQLLVALHGEDQDAFECHDFWRSYADENGLVLLCPQLPYSDGKMDRGAAQVALGQALQAAYSEVSLQGMFFVVGFGEGGAMALQYTAQFPQAINGLVAISSEDFPPLTSAARMPVLLLTGTGDRAASDAAQAYVEQMTTLGVTIRLVELDERGDRLTGDAGRLTSDFLEEIRR